MTTTVYHLSTPTLFLPTSQLQLSIGSLSKLIFSQANVMWLHHTLKSTRASFIRIDSRQRDNSFISLSSISEAFTVTRYFRTRCLGMFLCYCCCVVHVLSLFLRVLCLILYFVLSLTNTTFPGTFKFQFSFSSCSNESIIIFRDSSFGKFRMVLIRSVCISSVEIDTATTTTNTST